MSVNDAPRKNNQYRKNVKRYALLVIGSGLLLTLLSLYSYITVNDQWQTYTANNTNVYSLQEQLVQQLGYGGFIHNFKNLVIRKDIDQYEAKIRNGLDRINTILDELQTSGDYSAEAIYDIRHTLRQYEANLDIVIQMIHANKSAEDIDLVVSIDDKNALAALAAFDAQVRARFNAEQASLTNSFTKAFFVHITSAAIFITLLLVYLRNLLKANQNEQELARQAQAGSKAKSDFLANMSHEIRTPLNGVMGTLQVLQRSLLESNNKRLVENALISTRSLLTIINDILDFSKIEANELLIERIPFSLPALTEAISSDLRPITINKGIYFKVNLEPNGQPNWIGDPVRIRQILLNLSSNAIKFTHEGGVTLNIKAHCHGHRQGLVFSVVDTGIGMSDSAQALLFKRFTQADNTITRKYGGTGLGMAIVQRLVQLMDGEVAVVSEESKGTQVEVFLPLEQAEKQQPSISPVATVDESPLLANALILIAEDNEINKEVVKSMLETTQATLVFAENGEQAIEKYTSLHPDLILMDIQMPIMDGVQACLKIREVDENIPIVALTANVMKEDVEHYNASGFNAHLPKPLDMNTLHATLISLLTLKEKAD